MAEPSERDDLPTARWETLQFRAARLQQLRRFFESRGFLEVETPLLSHDTVADLHIDPLPVVLFTDPRRPQTGRTLWLQTSPEFAMKRLLAAGAEKIFQVAKAFRAGERGALHNPEFTIVEWYRVGDTMAEGIELLAELAGEMFQSPRVERLSYEEAFLRYAQIQPHTASLDELATRGAQLPGGNASVGTTRDEWLNFLLATAVEPQLGTETPTILYDYPASQAALARTRRTPDGYEVAERFELYARGIELANGYHELLDAETLRQRNRTANELRRRDGRYPVPEESRLLRAMERGLPPCAGVALGFDRLLMALTGAREIGEVLPFPVERA
jgi:elongation factor P--(R)-beta-lysine ligase